jgi:hypothetical protein
MARNSWQREDMLSPNPQVGVASLMSMLVGLIEIGNVTVASASKVSTNQATNGASHFQKQSEFIQHLIDREIRPDLTIGTATASKASTIKPDEGR